MSNKVLSWSPLEKEMSFLYESIKEVGEKEFFRSTGISLQHIIRLHSRISDPTAHQEIKSALKEIKTHLVEHCQSYGFSCIERILAFEIALNYSKQFSSENQKLLTFFNQHLKPKNYQVFKPNKSAKHRSLAKQAKNGIAFIKPLGHFNHSTSPKTFNETINGVELYIPLFGNKILLVTGNLDSKIALSEFPSQYNANIAPLKIILEGDCQQLPTDLSKVLLDFDIHSNSY